MGVHDLLTWLPSWVALLVSFVVLGLQIRERFVPLRLEITQLQAAEAVDGAYLVFVCLALTNDASRGRVVYNLVVEATNAQVSRIVPQCDLASQAATFRLRKPEGVTVPMGALLLPPLDVLPHQTLAKWVAIRLSSVKAPPNSLLLPKEVGVPIWFRGMDLRRRESVRSHPLVIYPGAFQVSMTYESLVSEFTPNSRPSNLLNSDYFYWAVLAVVFLVLLALWLHNRGNVVIPPPTVPTP